MPSVPVRKVSFGRLFRLAGMLYSTQFHLVVPSPGRVVISSAYSFVPAGGLVQARGKVAPDPSHVYSGGNTPPLTPAELVKLNAPVFEANPTGKYSDCLVSDTPLSVTATG